MFGPEYIMRVNVQLGIFQASSFALVITSGLFHTNGINGH
jgi:hypothetical protein